jgi:methylated-DNA-[protein]-cysteine S-methyltransferase
VPELIGDVHESTRSGNGSRAGGRDQDVAHGLATRVEAHLAGRSTSYGDIPIDLTWCTGFQHELARALREVPWGEIVSYGELAALAGRPGAARAAGTFCAQSRFALIFPCHRVVSASGIGGYGDAGLDLKRRLLALEGIEL